MFRLYLAVKISTLKTESSVNNDCVSQISKKYVIEKLIMSQLMRKITNISIKYKHEMLYKVVSKSLSSLTSKRKN